MADENGKVVNIREFWGRDPLPLRCHECDAPLFPSRVIVGKDDPAKRTAACDGENFMNHGHINVYRRIKEAWTIGD